MSARQRISVRVLAEQVHRRGDLHFRYDRPANAAQGRAAHSWWQAAHSERARAEVAVTAQWQGADLALEVGGRIDGVLDDDGNAPLLVELKATRTRPERLHAHLGGVHLAQLGLYAHLYRCARSADGRPLPGDSIEGRLEYLLLGEGDRVEDSHVVQARWSAAEAAALFDASCSAWAERLRAHRAWCARRDASLVALEFPETAFRPGQRELARAIYRTQVDGSALAAEAPTGTGKTLGTLFPAVKALGQGHGQRVFYATARTTGRLAAEQACQQLHDAGAQLRVLTLSARERICPTPGTPCEPEACPRAAGYFERNRAALVELLARDAMPADSVAEVATAHRVCPFELGLDAAPWADVVVGDYNYVFDPLVRIKRLLGSSASQHLLVDEAHNLPDRAREMFSADLTAPAVARALRETPVGHPLRRSLLDIRRQLRALLPERGQVVLETLPPALLRAALRTSQRWQAWLEAGEGDPAALPGVQDLVFQLQRLQAANEWADAETFRVLADAEPVGRLRLWCMDPADRLAEVITRQRSSVLFSATPGPLPAFARSSGLGEARCVRLPSPFPPEHLGVFVVADVPTWYRQRRASLGAVVATLQAMVAGRPGNYLAFLPSHAYLALVADAFPEQPGLEVLRQTPAMPEDARGAFLDAYRSPPPAGRSRLGFAVMGGPFAEAVDLPGEQLIGVAVIGTGVPPPAQERELLRAHHGADGDLLAYRMPALQRVLQTAGRLIRTAADRGVLVLVDPRFLGPDLLPLLPPHWQLRRQPAAGLAAALADFWAGQEGSAQPGAAATARG